MSLSQPYDFLIQWHLTERCNLKCKHCYQEGGNFRELSLAEIYRTIEEICEMLQAWHDDYDLDFSPSFNVTGGEPFLRLGFFDILDRLVQTGFEIYILSNGTCITLDMAQRIAALGVHGVQISLEGPEVIHEQVRGRGSFAAALQGIRNLLQAGVKVSLNATISRMNAGYFQDMVGLARELGVPRLGFSRLVPSGRGKDLLGDMLTLDETKRFYENILSMQVPGLEIATGDPMAAQMNATPPADDENNAFPAGGCAAGVSGLTILTDGTVTPCRRLPIALGKVGENPLREIWATSPVLEQLRKKDLYRGKCGKCPRWSACRGCRAIAYAFAQAQGNPDFLAPDPQCFIEPI
jgi:radical SAM protein with 4Fe4S-binding SPASM domain